MLRTVKTKSLSFLTLGALILHALSPAIALADPPRTLDSQTADQLRQLQDELRRNAANGPSSATGTDPLDGFTTEFFKKVWKEPKYRYILAPIVAGELIYVATKWKQMRLALNTWNRQVGAVADVANRMGKATSEYAKAEQQLLKSLAEMEAADKADMLKNLDGVNARTRGMLERALKPATPPATPPGATPAAPSAGSALTVEEAALKLEQAYENWQKQAANEARILRAGGRPSLTEPKPLAEMTASADAKTRALTRLSYTGGEFFKFKNEGLKAMAQEAKMEIGSIRSFWRKARTAVLLLAVPAIAVGVAIYYDYQLERSRRIEDLNRAAEQDRSLMLNSILLYFQRPILKSIIKAWEKVRRADRSVLAPFPCPYSLKGIGVDNPDLGVIGSLAMQIMIEMTKDGVDVIEVNGDRAVVISYEFYRRMIERIITRENRALANLDGPTLTQLTRDLSFEAFHYYDTDDDNAAATPVDPGANPGNLGFGRP